MSYTSFILASYLALLLSYGALFGDRIKDCGFFSRAYTPESPFCVLNIHKESDNADTYGSSFLKPSSLSKTGMVTFPVGGVPIQIDFVSNALYSYQKLARFRATCKEHKKFVAMYGSWTPEQFQSAIVQTEQEYRDFYVKTHGHDQAVYGIWWHHNNSPDNITKRVI